MDYPYNMLQDLFHCSSKTIAVAKVNCILFSCGGTPPAKFKSTRQCVSPDVLMELSEFFNRESISRPSSCRSVITDGEETPVRYWKDNVKEIVNQYLLEFPNLPVFHEDIVCPPGAEAFSMLKALQDAWFSQTAMDVWFHWMEEFPGFRVYLFSDSGLHYHNTKFILYLAEVRQAFHLTLVEYINFEAGKGTSSWIPSLPISVITLLDGSKAPEKLGKLNDISLSLWKL
ncbi:unnamed protein product [Porites evermanni]|uniref:Uncharacterized protein n=1 Tax=Porites evermanni TaxID=104178 RepID=A0ABN8LBM6_9CNID|nr:unnamed protein product [Porites evermanni]